MLEAFNFRVILEYMPLYLQCFMATLWLSVLSLIGAILVGIIACAMRLSQSRAISRTAAVYIESIRSTPLLVQLYFFYFGLPTLGIMLPEWVTGVIALTLNSGAYYAEIIRAGIQAIAYGQIEAGIASGLNYFQRMRYIILPQALGMTIRPMLGQAIVLVKDSSLLSSDFDYGADTCRPDVDIGSIHAHRRVPDHCGFLSTSLLPAQNLLGLV